MLQFLLDEHISPAVCSIVRDRRSQVLIESLLEWRDAGLRGKDDHIVLAAAAEAGYALVTYDLRTIPPLLHVWAAKGLSHHGVIFVDERTCRPARLFGNRRCTHPYLGCYGNLRVEGPRGIRVPAARGDQALVGRCQMRRYRSFCFYRRVRYQATARSSVRCRNSGSPPRLSACWRPASAVLRRNSPSSHASRMRAASAAGSSGGTNSA